MSSTALVTTDNSDRLDYVVPFNRQFYQFDMRPVEEGGAVVSSCKSAQKIAPAAYTSFCQSTSDAKWKDYVSPTNLMFLRAAEGDYPYAIFSVEGHENSKFLCNPVPVEVAQKLFPKMYEQTAANPEKYNLKLTGIEESKIKRNQMRIDALKWKPDDCKSTDNKSKTLKPCRPKPPANSPKFWACSAANKKVFDDIVKALAPKPASTKRKAGEAEAVDVNAPPAAVSFKTKDLLPGIDWEMSADLNGGTPELKVIGDRCFVHVYKKPKVAQSPEDAAAAAAAEDGEEEEEEQEP